MFGVTFSRDALAERSARASRLNQASEIFWMLAL